MKTTILQQRRLNTVLRPLFTALILLVFSLASAWAKSPHDIVLPAPEPPFKGKIGHTYKDSQPDKIPVTKAPAGAPNVLVVLIDDTGFGAWGTFGGQVPTPQPGSTGARWFALHTVSHYGAVLADPGSTADGAQTIIQPVAAQSRKPATPIPAIPARFPRAPR